MSRSRRYGSLVDVTEPVPEGLRPRDHAYRYAALLLAVVALPAAYLSSLRRRPGRHAARAGARHLACQWALAVRFPAEDLDGLTPQARTAFEAARTAAFWRDGELIGLTSGHRDPEEQARLFATEVRLTGSVPAARLRVLPPGESRHVAGTALDIRPTEGARWLEEHGFRWGLYRTYDNEWWHFEHHPAGRPRRLPHPAAARYAIISAWKS
jgi:D-alanyl-D-alanine carboxypeptidase